MAINRPFFPVARGILDHLDWLVGPRMSVYLVIIDNTRFSPTWSGWTIAAIANLASVAPITARRALHELAAPGGKMGRAYIEIHMARGGRGGGNSLTILNHINGSQVISSDSCKRSPVTLETSQVISSDSSRVSRDHLKRSPVTLETEIPQSNQRLTGAVVEDSIKIENTQNIVRPQTCELRQASLTTPDLPGLESESAPLPKLASKSHRARRWAYAFDEHFWPRYPRKCAKIAARKAWARLEPKCKPTPADPESWKEAFSDRYMLILRLLEHFEAVVWADPDFIPHPATWLRSQSFTPEDVQSVIDGRRPRRRYDG